MNMSIEFNNKMIFSETHLHVILKRGRRVRSETNNGFYLQKAQSKSDWWLIYCWLILKNT